MPPVVRIGDEEFVAWEDLRWSRTAGTTADTRRVHVPEVVAARLRVGSDITLEVIPSGRGALKIEHLTVLEVLPGAYPFTRAIVIADKRWRWPYHHITRSYNVRRRTTEVQFNGLWGERLEKGQLAGDVIYQNYSLRDRKDVWTLDSIIFDIMSELNPDEEYRIEGDPDPTGFRLEDFEPDDPGDVALSRLLHFMPGWTVCVWDDGTINFYNELTKAEEKIVEQHRGTIQVGSSSINIVDRSAQRPCQIDVLFTPECELRIDWPGSLRTTRDVDQLLFRTPVQMTQVSEFYVEMGGKRYYRGSWVPWAEYLAGPLQAAIPERLSYSGIFGSQTSWFLPFDDKLLCKHWSSNLNALEQAYVHLGLGFPDTVWQGRINSIRTNWRQTFAFSRSFRDRVYVIRPYLAAVINVENGIRAPSPVFCDFTVVPSIKGLVLGTRSGQKADIRSWTVLRTSDNLAECEPAPFFVNIFDEENGLFRLDDAVQGRDAWGHQNSVLPGAVDNKEQLDCTAGGLLLTYNALRLKSDWKFTTVLSAVQASPNSNARLYRVTVKPEEVVGILGVSSLGDCRGPMMEIRVGPAGGWWTARFVWQDNRASSIVGSFFGEDSLPSELLSNPNEIETFARSAAAKVYATMLDRNEGTQLGTWHPKAVPTGRLSSVTHAVGKDGWCDTLLVCPPYRGEINVWGWMPASVRNQLQKKVIL